MWRRTCLAVAVCVALTVFSISSAKALLVNGSYTINLTGVFINPSPGTFDVIGGTIQNFTLDLLTSGVPANANSTYSTNPALVTVATMGSMFAGTISNDVFTTDTILFQNDNFWLCISVKCSASGLALPGRAPGGSASFSSGPYVISQTSVSEVPLPAGVWLFLSALSGLALFGWRRESRAAA